MVFGIAMNLEVQNKLGVLFPDRKLHLLWILSHLPVKNRLKTLLYVFLLLYNYGNREKPF